MATNTHLNRIVQGLWIGSQLSQIEVACISSYLKQGHEFHLYAYSSFPNLPKGAVWKDANEIIPEQDIFTYEKGPGKGSYAAFANLFRYKLLFEKGGWWSDMDFICLKPLPKPSRMFIAAEWKTQPSRWSGAIRTRLTQLERLGWRLKIIKSNINFSKPCNGLIFCNPHNPILEQAYTIAKSQSTANLSWGDTGPNLINQLLTETDSDKYIIGLPELFLPVGGYQVKIFFDSCSPTILNNSYTVHIYNELWRRMGKSKEGPFPAGSLIEQILQDVIDC